ncbi:MAG TPA: nucleoside monophosphate kinase [Candidatus Paceibacterota bacterium]
MLHTVIFIGRSGCGKGTQAALMRERITREDGKRILYVETGDHFRQFIRGKGYSSGLSRKIYEQDIRQPDFLACWIWSNMLIGELREDMHLVFDGAPRARDEAEILTSALDFYKREKPAVIYLDVSRQWSEEKLLKRARIDDLNLEKIDKRLDWFDEKVLPVLEYFKREPYYRFLEINGEQSIEKVHSDIVARYEYSE